MEDYCRIKDVALTILLSVESTADMNYFTAQLWADINSPRSKDAMEEWNRNLEKYRQQLSGIVPMLGVQAQRFFRVVSLHDGTLTRMEVGDQIDNVESTWQSRNVNSRKIAVRLQVLTADGDRIFKLEYKKVTRVGLSFPGEALFPAGKWPNFGDWGYDELSEVRSGAFRHEVLFSSGATIVIEFERFSFSKSPAKRATRRRKP